MPSRVIIPKKLSVNPAKMAAVITNTLNNVALDMKVDFEVTAQTWQHKPAFAIASPSPYVRTVGTDDPIYGYVSGGTRPHTIAPRGGGVLAFPSAFRSKTLPRSIASTAGGSSGGTVFTRRPVQHPGTAPRDFDTVIAQKWDKQVGAVFQRAIDAAVS